MIYTVSDIFAVHLLVTREGTISFCWYYICDLVSIKEMRATTHEESLGHSRSGTDRTLQ